MIGGSIVIRTIRVIILTLALSVFVGGMSRADSAPVWPQTFSLCPGEHAQFAVPVTQPGVITVSITWQGSGLITALVDPSGELAATSAQQGPPAKISYTVTSGDLQKGVLWMVAVGVPSSPKPGQQPVVSGQVMVNSPAADAQKVLALQRTSRDQLASRVNAFRSQTTSATSASVGMNKQRSGGQDIAALTARLRDDANTYALKYNARLEQLVRSLNPSASLMVSSVRPKNPLAGKATGVHLLGDPAILDVTPAKGRPGETVVIRGKNLPTDKTQCEAWFVVNKDTPVPAKVLSAVKDKDIVSYQVQVPDDSVIAKVYDGQVYMKSTAVDSQSNSLPFQFDPLPVITAITPIMGAPGVEMTLNGANFKPGDEVHFVMPDGKDVAPSQHCPLLSDGRIIWATVPDYSSYGQSTAKAYVVTKLSVGKGTGPARVFPLATTRPHITHLDRGEGGAGEPVHISGEGFANPVEVYFNYAEGVAKKGALSYSVGSELIADIPRYTGQSASHDGYIQVAAANGLSEKAPFRFLPSPQEVIPLDISKCDGPVAGFVKGDDSDSLFISSSAVPEIRVYHVGGFMMGHKNDDEWFRGVRLRNGWVVDRVEFHKNNTQDESDAYVVESHEGTDNPYVKVHWWDTPSHDSVSYQLLVWIRGTRDVPYR